MKAEKETVSGGMCLFGLKVMKTGQLCIESGPWSTMAGAGPGRGSSCLISRSSGWVLWFSRQLCHLT